MQVVYSGGSSTPSPSPRLQRKNYTGFGGYGRPVMPGYMIGAHNHHPGHTHPHPLPHPHPHPPMVPRPSREKVTGAGEGERSLRDSIPAMSKPLAVVCLLLNIVLPGLGTLVSGLTVLCGSQVRPKGSSKGSALWTNSGVALLQFCLTFLLLLGWIWSIMWGTAFLSISKEFYKKPHVEEVSTNGRPKPASTPKREGHQRENNSSTHYHPTTSTSSIPRTQAHNGHSPSTSATSEPHRQQPQQQQQPQHQQHQQRQQQQQDQRSGSCVNAVGGSAATPDIYLTPSSSASERPQPIIVLQEAPITVNHSDTPPAPSRALMNARTRHEKILQRQMSDNDLSPFILTHQQLEAIVIHDAPVLSRPPRPHGVDEDDPAFAPLPKC